MNELSPLLPSEGSRKPEAAKDRARKIYDQIRGACYGCRDLKDHQRAMRMLDLLLKLLAKLDCIRENRCKPGFDAFVELNELAAAKHLAEICNSLDINEERSGRVFDLLGVRPTIHVDPSMQDSVNVQELSEQLKSIQQDLALKHLPLRHEQHVQQQRDSLLVYIRNGIKRLLGW